MAKNTGKQSKIGPKGLRISADNEINSTENLEATDKEVHHEYAHSKP